MKLYLDSMVWVYFYEKHPQFHPTARALIRRHQVLRSRFVSSELVLAELLVVPKRRSDLFSAARYRHFFRSPAIALVPFSNEIAERFSDLRAFSRVKPADALHLALAASAGVDYFVTYDAKLHSLSVPGITHICRPEAVS